MDPRFQKSEIGARERKIFANIRYCVCLYAPFLHPRVFRPREYEMTEGTALNS